MATTEAPAGKSGEELRFEANVERAQQLGYDIDPDNCDPTVLEMGTRRIGPLLTDLIGMNDEAAQKLLGDLDIRFDAEITDDQYQRALDRKSKGGLRGKALATWIITGDAMGKATSAKAKRTAKEQRTTSARKGQDARPASARKRTTAEKAATKRQVEATHAALTKAGRKDPTPAKGPREGSGLWAALQILKAARNPLTPDEIWDRIKAKRLAPGMKGKTPAATIGAQLATALKAGKIDGLSRPEPGKYALAKGGK